MTNSKSRDGEIRPAPDNTNEPHATRATPTAPPEPERARPQPEGANADRERARTELRGALARAKQAEERLDRAREIDGSVLTEPFTM
jgi:hypothetical protein